jgi:hypothetical protein
MIGLGLGLGEFRKRPDPVNDILDGWTVRAAANGGTISAATRAAVRSFLATSLALGVLPRLHRLNLFCGDNLAACLTPQVQGRGGAVDINANFIEANYTENLGLLTGSGRWLNTGCAFPAGGMLGGVTMDCRSSITATNIHFFGATEGAARCGFNKTGVGSEQESIWGGVAGGTIATQSISFAGVWRATRKSATLNRISRDATIVTATAENTVNLPTLPCYVFARNLNGSASGIVASGARWSGYAIDDGTIPDADELAWRQAWSAFRVAMGR